MRGPERGEELTGQNEEDDPVHNQNWPEHWNIEDLEPAAEEGDNNSPRGPVPELEFGKAANERLELLVLLGGESAYRAIFHLIVERFV